MFITWLRWCTFVGRQGDREGMIGLEAASFPSGLGRRSSSGAQFH